MLSELGGKELIDLIKPKILNEVKAQIKAEAEAKVKADADAARQKARAEAVKTMRKSRKFGVEGDEATFEWPSAQDLLAMPSDKPVKVASISYRTCGRYLKEI